MTDGHPFPSPPGRARIVCAIGAHVDDVLHLANAASAGQSVPAVAAPTTIGGCAFNVAAALARAGHEVSHAALRGADADGELVVDALEQCGIADVGLALPGETTGRYVAMLQPDGTLALAAAAMAIYARSDALIRHPPFLDAARAADLLVLDANADPSRIEDLRAACGARTRLALLATSASKAPALSRVLPGADILFANESEWDALGSLAEAVPLAFLTRGAEGATALERGRPVASIPSAARTVRSVIGAGDAFAAGALDSLLRGHAPQSALRHGTVRAAACLARPGARDWLDDHDWSDRP